MTLGHITRLMSETLNLIDDMTTDEIKDAVRSMDIDNLDFATDAALTLFEEALCNRLSHQEYMDWGRELIKFINECVQREC